MDCPKCHNKMEEGLIADHAYINYQRSMWASKRKYLGYSLENKKDIVAYRCSNCGYVEQYAKNVEK